MEGVHIPGGAGLDEQMEHKNRLEKEKEKERHPKFVTRKKSGRKNL